VRGKLVPQDPNDIPACELLEKISDEKSRLIEKGKINQQKPLPEINENEKMFDTPSGWCWTRSETVANFIDPHPSHRTPPEYEGGIPYVGYTDIDHVKGINFTNTRKIAPKVFEEHLERYQLKVGDFVFGKIGTLGQPFFLSEPFDYCLSANLILIQPKTMVINPKFLAMFLDSPTFINVLVDQTTNSTHGVFGIKKARIISIPLPPLAEQHRIVAKVDELMALCNQLENQLTATETDSRRLLEAVLHEALAHAPKEAA
jgi:type I restriction enzyme, S subunit